MNNDAQTIHDLALILCRGMVAKPNLIKVTVNFRPASGIMSVEIAKDPEDQPKLIGKKGSNFKSIQTVLDRAGELMQTEIDLAIPAQSDRKVDVHSPFTADAKWSHKAMLGDLLKVCGAIFQHPVKVEVYNASVTTNFDIGYSEDELFWQVTPEQLEESVSRIFHGHGRNQGREVKMKLYIAKET